MRPKKRNQSKQLQKCVKKSIKKVQTRRITDLNIDCLESLCLQLNLIELANVAESNIWLRTAARLAYRKRMIYRRLRLTTETIELFTTSYPIEFISSILRNFGDQIIILKIELDDKTNARNWRSIRNDINRFCSKTLHSIALNRCPNYILQRLTNQFNAVRWVTLENDTDLKIKYLQLNQHFPNMSDLSISNCQTSDQNCFVTHFPNLRKLQFNQADDTQGISIINVIRSNPQIQELTLELESNSNLFDELTSDDLAQLETLKISFILQDNNGKELHLPAVRTFEIITFGFVENFITTGIPFTFRQLETLKLEFSRPFYEIFLDFIIRNANLTTLNLITYESNEFMRDEDWMKIANALKKLKNFTVEGCLISSNALNEFTRISKALECFEIINDPRRELSTTIKLNWQVIKNGPDLIGRRIFYAGH